MSEVAKQVRGEALRDKLVGIAAELFYANGVRAVGVDEVVRRAGVAKASLYRWFPSKDDLVLAVLQRRDGDFWAKWDSTAAQHPDPREQLDAQLAWIQDLAMRTDYRGCAFVNTAAEFDGDESQHIRNRCLDHEEELRRRLRALTGELGGPHSDRLADRLHISIVGALATGGLYRVNGPAAELRALAADLLSAHLPADGRAARDVGGHPR
ncbi:TetR/AcrR family transcriptional regulator [Rhodococcus pyridinivorans]|uniref:TetR/AcrR family transcriptional regulator n=1 Tax=Rhodococcus pyridinivorans TaxID=103816 RepID=A0A7M2XGW2_9NOCA|nr:TetR/AcrR family transcriptional regulator [Rhodococcus pyridinivorans]QOV96935.1 TetR/AcrR family transcriptional regulator [Rhodococcus pyridinivorans]WMM70899.1 TetR/AcrR family transcriptional regulator [Rhodococcus pyridinivorans]